MKNKVSPEMEANAMKVAKGIQKAGQTKEQTKLIAQGIEKGIAEYKKQHSKKLRELDKQRKQQTKQRQKEKDDSEAQQVPASNNVMKFVPWALLITSWLGFAVFIAMRL